MNLKKIGRALVCLILVCCLLINISPIKAEALSAEIAVIGVAAGLVIIPLIIGLGVMPGPEGSTAFDNVVSGCQDALTAAGYITDGLMNVYSLTNGQYRYAVDVDLIDWVRNWLFDSGTLTATEDYVFADYAGYGDTMINRWETAMTYPSYCVAYNESKANWYIFYSQGTISYTQVDNGYMISATKALYYYQIYKNGNAYSSNFSANVAVGPYVNVSIDGKTYDITTELDLTLGAVVAPSISFADGYAEWQRAVDEGDGALPAPPVSLPIQRTEDESKDLTQEEVWDGTATYDDTITDTESGTGTGTDTGTEAGLLSSILAVVQAIPSAIEAMHKAFVSVLTDVWNGIISLPTAIAEAFSEVLTTVIGWLESIWDAIGSLPVSIADAVAAVFVPSTDYVTAKVDALRAEFAFMDGIISTGEFIRDSVSGDSGPPVIYVDLGLANTDVYGSERVLLADFSWYEPYKGTVDSMLSAAMWAFFGWRVFLKLPGIISGESGYVGEIYSHYHGGSGKSGSSKEKRGNKS